MSRLAQPGDFAVITDINDGLFFRGDSISTLRTFVPDNYPNNMPAIIKGSGIFCYDTASVEGDNGASIIKPESKTDIQTGRWYLRIPEGYTSSESVDVGSLIMMIDNLQRKVDSLSFVSTPNSNFKDKMICECVLHAFNGISVSANTSISMIIAFNQPVDVENIDSNYIESIQVSQLDSFFFDVGDFVSFSHIPTKVFPYSEITGVTHQVIVPDLGGHYYAGFVFQPMVVGRNTILLEIRNTTAATKSYRGGYFNLTAIKRGVYV